MTFTTWLETFIAEKGFNLDQTLTVEGASGTNYIPLGCLVDTMKSAPATEQRAIKSKLVQIDFSAPGQEIHFFQFLAKAIAV